MKLGLMLFRVMSARHGAVLSLIVLGLSSGHAVGGQPDLAVTQTCPEAIQVGERITCSLVYTNQGRAKATGVTLTAALPPEFALNPVTLGNASREGNTLVWSLGDLRPGKGGSVSYQVLVATNAADSQPTSVPNFARISGAETEANFGNNDSLLIILIEDPITASPLVSLTNCPGTTALFSTTAGGSGSFTYQWLKDGKQLKSQTDSTLILENIVSADAGVYSVVVSNDTGSVTNSATLTVSAETTTSPLVNLLRNPDQTAVFTTIASGTGPFSYLWRKNGDEILGETNSSLVLSNLTSDDEGVYTVETSGSCNTAASSALLHVNLAPTVGIVSPTNNAIFIAPAHFTIVADASDADGSIVGVQFVMQTTNLNVVEPAKLANRYSTGVTNVPEGDYVLTVTVTDDGGVSSTSAPVIVRVLPPAPVTVVSPMQFNPQTGLFQQIVRVSNLTDQIFEAVRVYVDGLTNNTIVYNASGTNDGVPYLQSLTSISPGGFLDLVIEYYSPTRTSPNPTFVTEVLPTKPGATPAPSGTEVPINREVFLSDGTFLLEFSTATNRFYVVEYSSDFRGWTAAQQPPIPGNGSSIQWIDNGQPKTESVPTATGARFYRVILLPQP